MDAVAVGRVGRRDIIVSGSTDDTVRMWDPATGQPLGDPLIAVVLDQHGPRLDPCSVPTTPAGLRRLEE